MPRDAFGFRSGPTEGTQDTCLHSLRSFRHHAHCTKEELRCVIVFVHLLRATAHAVLSHSRFRPDVCARDVISVYLIRERGQGAERIW